MKRLTVRSRAFVGTTVLCLASVLRLPAQTTAPSEGQSPKDDTIVLSPFVVEASEDSGYVAKSTLAGTRVRTDLKDVASSISVVTQQFLTDTGSHNSQDLLVYTANTEVAGLRGNFSGQGGNTVFNEPLGNPNNQTRVRGLDAADNTRDYFLTDIPWDGFNVGRVDLQRGPNSTLFGVGSPAGIINTSLNGASYRTGYTLENVTSSYGSQRNRVDFNQVIIDNQLAVRFAAVNDQERYKQKPAFNNSTRYYGALKFDPQLFNVANSHTSLRANYENGRVNSNNPRTLPPDDQITPWFISGNDAYGNPGLNKITINEFVTGQGPSSPLVNSTLNRTSWAQGRTYWPTPIAYFNGSNPSTPGVSPGVLSNLPTNVIIGEFTTGWAINAAGQIAPPNQPGQSTNNGIGGLLNFQPKAVPNFQHYASGALPGGSFYANKVLTDASVFDFYNQLLDGDNKREWQKWNAFNIALTQTFFNDRLGFELAYDKQSYSQGQIGFLGGENYAINIDVNQTLADRSANPNVGRPYVANASESGNQSQKIDRDSTRLTAFGEVRASDWIHRPRIAAILGRHVFTGLLGLDHKEQKNVNWSQYAAGLDWATNNNFDLSVKISNYRLFNWVNYIGPTLAGASSASGAHLSNIQTIIAPGANSSVRWFDSHWKPSLNPNDPSYVNPADPYTYTNNDTGAVTNSNQANNPANYVGWRQLPVTWMNANNPQDFPSMVTGGSKAKFRDRSQALVWQGYLLNDTLVATYSWRKDSIVNYSTGAPIDASTSLAALDYADNPDSRRETEGQTRTWGAVYHVPETLMKHLPGDVSLSFFGNKAHNFKADAPRTNFAGQQIPNPDGETKEYGAMIGLKENRITFKATHYETTVHWATLSGNAVGSLGGNSYLLYLDPAWGYGYAAQVQAGLDGKYGNTTLNGAGDTAGGTSWNYAARDAIILNPNADLSVIGTPAGAANVPVATYGYGGTGTVTMKDIVNAWLNLPVPDGFFDYWGITGNRPNPAKARATGKLYDGWNTPFIQGTTVGVGVGGQQPSGSQNPVSTVDNISKGWEYELSGNPTKNWNITINYSRTQATKTNIDAITTKFMADNLAFFQGPGGQLRLWGASQTAGYGTPDLSGPVPKYSFTSGQTNGSTIGPGWIAGVYNPYLVTALAQGQSAPEVSPWRLNLITNYSFDRGRLKNFSIGGAARLEAGRILGYHLDPTTLVLDPTKPWIGPDEKHYDLWLRYAGKFAIGRNIKWSIQLNLRNIGEKSKLTPISYEPDGTIAGARIVEGTTWQLTNTFEF